MKRKLLIITAILSMVITLVGCTTKQISTSSTTVPSSTEATTTVPSISVPASVSGIETTLIIYARVNPSVVLINVVLPPSISDIGGAALGSGFVWDTQGDIVTNNHVIDGAQV